MTLLNFLKDIYATNSQLILFGEAKNAGIIALNGAIVIGMSTLYSNDLRPTVFYLITYVIVCNVLSGVVAISALAAQKRPKELKSTADRNENYLFFGTISHQSPKELVEKITKKYDLKSSNVSMELDYARQLIIISQIATRKFTRFNIALMFTISSMVSPLGYLLYYFFYHPNRVKRFDRNKN